VAYQIWVQDGSLSLGHDGCLHFVGITNSGSFTVFKGALASRHPVGRWGSAESPDGTGGIGNALAVLLPDLNRQCCSFGLMIEDSELVHSLYSEISVYPKSEELP
jgi:hypothetical protein